MSRHKYEKHDGKLPEPWEHGQYWKNPGVDDDKNK
jgi:hypothetical protein